MVGREDTSDESSSVMRKRDFIAIDTAVVARSVDTETCRLRFVELWSMRGCEEWYVSDQYDVAGGS